MYVSPLLFIQANFAFRNQYQEWYRVIWDSPMKKEGILHSIPFGVSDKQVS